jgi:hypothetical protein
LKNSNLNGELDRFTWEANDVEFVRGDGKPDSQAMPKLSDKSKPVKPFVVEMLGLSFDDPLNLKLAERSALGKKRYGMELHSFNGRNPVKDFIEEIVDGIQYCGQAMMETDDPIERQVLFRSLMSLRVTFSLLDTISKNRKKNVLTGL